MSINNKNNSYQKHKFSYWSSRGVPGPQPWTPFGTMLDYFRFGQQRIEIKWAQKYGKVYGLYRGYRPVFTILDTDLIKQVMVKDFPVFVNRQRNFSSHPIMSKTLFASVDEQWRRIRAITSPSFTTGKLRGMYRLMNYCVERLSNYFDNKIETTKGVINAKEVITGFTIDVIARTSFAVETDVYKEGNQFLKYGTNLAKGSVFRALMALSLPQWFNKMIRNTANGNSNETVEFFIELSRNLIKQRQMEKLNSANSAKRTDIIQLLMDAFVYENDNDNEKSYKNLEVSMLEGKLKFDLLIMKHHVDLK